MKTVSVMAWRSQTCMEQGPKVVLELLSCPLGLQHDGQNATSLPLASFPIYPARLFPLKLKTKPIMK